MNSFKRILGVGGAAWLIAGGVSADLIGGINFYRNGGQANLVEDPNNPGTSLITALGTDQWYNPVDPSGGSFPNAFNLHNATQTRALPGALTGVTVQWRTGATWAPGTSSEFTGTANEQVLLREYFDDNSAAGITVTLSGLSSLLGPGQSLTMRAYSSGAENAGNPTFVVTSGIQAIPLDYLNPVGSDGRAIYEVPFTGITADTWTISVPQRNTGGNTVTNFAALSVEVVPEPGTLGLLSLGLVGLVRLVRAR